MASGGYHGGSTHSGSHHSGGGGFGGFSGGGFSSGGGGGYSGGGFSSGSSSGSSGGGYGGGGSYHDDDYERPVRRNTEAEDRFGQFMVDFSGLFVIVFFMHFMIAIEVPGLNWINLGIFVATGILYIVTFQHSKRLSEISYIKKNDVYISDGSVSSADIGDERVGDRFVWYCEKDKTYYISFAEPEKASGKSRFDDDDAYGSDNILAVKETIRRTPKIFWISTRQWFFFAVICLFCNLFFYEAVIPIFENAIMSDFAFAVFDHIIFYLPSGLAFLSVMLCMVFTHVKDYLLYECAVRIVNDKKAKEESRKALQSIADRLSRNWYYNICPNCGAETLRTVKSCQSCGSSLEVTSISKNVGGIHKIPKEAEE